MEYVDNVDGYVYGVDYVFEPYPDDVNFPVIKFLTGDICGVRAYCKGISFREDVENDACYCDMDIEVIDYNDNTLDEILNSNMLKSVFSSVVSHALEMIAGM